MNEIAHQNGEGEVRDTLYLSGGAALVVLGVGLLMTNSTVRRAVVSSVQRLLPDLQAPLAQGVAGILPDVERYLKMRKM
jgi:hypothetical protein